MVLIAFFIHLINIFLRGILTTKINAILYDNYYSSVRYKSINLCTSVSVQAYPMDLKHAIVDEFSKQILSDCYETDYEL